MDEINEEYEMEVVKEEVEEHKPIELEDVKEVLLKTELEKRDNKYYYYLDKNLSVCKIPKRYKKKDIKRKIKAKFTNLNLCLPKITVSGWCSNKFKTVRNTGKTGGHIWVPRYLVGKEFMMILIPKEDWIAHQLF